MASFSTVNKFVVNHIGAIINNEIASAIAKSEEKKSDILLLGLFFSSGMAISADQCYVSIPIFIDSYNPAIPLKMGCFQINDFSPNAMNFFLST